MSKPAAIVLLVHQGLSYLPAIAETADALATRVVVISSKAKDTAPIFKQEEYYSALCFTEQNDLNSESVKQQLEMLAKDFQLVAAISTFEGYRLIVAELNHLFGAPDCQVSHLETALDKLSMRQSLHKHALSSKRSWLLNPQTMDELQQKDIDVFIKPRCGVGSFGCFKLSKHTQWSDITRLENELHQDDFLEVAYLGNFDFIAEEYISGTEFSFEVAAIEGEYFTLAIHEKAGLEARDNTILENTDISPSLHLNPQEMRNGSDFIHSCLSALSLKEGAFHVEARFDDTTGKWEIIEVNPRIGGGFINHSVKEITNGMSILDAWIKVLLRVESVQVIKQQLAKLDAQFASPEFATIHSYAFGSPGKTLSKIELQDDKPNAEILNRVMSVGETLPDLSRELPVIEGMWKIPVKQLSSTLEVLNSGWVDVEYQ